MSNILKSIEELVAEIPKIDNQATFDELWKITTELFEKVKKRFELTMDPCCADLQPYPGKDLSLIHIWFFNLIGAVGIMFASKVGGALFDSWMEAAPFVIFGVFAFIVLIWAILVKDKIKPAEDAQLH